jgi:hypothetical protein
VTKCSSGFVTKKPKKLWGKFEATFRESFDSADGPAIKVYDMNKHMLKIVEKPASEGVPMSRAELIDDLIANTFVHPQQYGPASRVLPPGEGLLNDCLTATDVAGFKKLFGNTEFATKVIGNYASEISDKFGLSSVEIMADPISLYNRIASNTWHSAELRKSPTATTKVNPQTFEVDDVSDVPEEMDREKSRTSVTAAIEANLELVDKFAQVITADTENLVHNEILALESKEALSYIRALSQSKQCQLLACWIKIEDSICNANMHHLQKVQKAIDKCMDELHPIGLFNAKEWNNWRKIQKDENEEMDSFASDLGYKSLEELCAKHEEFLERQALYFEELVDQAAEYVDYKNVANVGAGCGAATALAGIASASSGGITYLTGSTMFSMGAGVGAYTCAAGLTGGLALGLAAAYASYRAYQLNAHKEFLEKGGDATDLTLSAGEGQKIVDRHQIAYKMLTKAMCACKTHKSSLTKLRADAANRKVIDKE